MNKDELFEIIDDASNIYEEWEIHNGEKEFLPEAIEEAFERVKEAVKKYIEENEK